MNAELTAALDALAEHADGIVAVDPQTMDIVYADANAHAATGYHDYKLVGRTLHTLLPDRLRWQHDGKMAGFLRTSETSRDMSTRVVVCRKRDGSLREMHIVIQRILDHGVAFFFLPDARMNALRAHLDAQPSSPALEVGDDTTVFLHKESIPDG